jgi:hypothetical protein
MPDDPSLTSPTTRRYKKKSWQDSEHNFTRRVIWYEGKLNGIKSFRLHFDIPTGPFDKFYDHKYKAQEAYINFVNGTDPSSV